MIKRYHAGGIRVKVENYFAGFLVTLQDGRFLHSLAPSPLEAAIYVVSQLLSPYTALETERWTPWNDTLRDHIRKQTQMRVKGGIQMWIRYRKAPFDSYLVKTLTHTIQVPTITPYKTAQTRDEAYTLVACRAARILAR